MRPVLRKSVILPASKSESNRALMIAAYGGFAPDFQNLSDSTDTKVLEKALGGCLCPVRQDVGIDTLSPSSVGMTCQHRSNAEQVVDIADCGTAARFLTTYLACTAGDWLLTGTPRMRQRPVRPLVDALTQLGADIQYVENNGFLPLRIKGTSIRGGKFGIDMTQSSQYASSLLLAAPTWPQGLELELFGELNSLPYLDMTLAMMRHFGAEAERKGNIVVVSPKPYQSRRFVVSADWTAASYWYEIAALCDACEIVLHSLKLSENVAVSKDHSSIQGDAIIAEWMQTIGVKTEPIEDGVVLTKVPFEKCPLTFDFSQHPDLFPTMAATCAGLQVEAHFSGISRLAIKESDRVMAMKTELEKIGTKVEHFSADEVLLKPTNHWPHYEKTTPLHFCCHNDHRVAMSLAPLGLQIGYLSFDTPEVVEKSYSRFWSDVSFLPIIHK